MRRQTAPYQTRQVRFVDQLSLVAAESAVSTSRHFLRLALSKWQAALIEDDVLLVASELVTNAVTVTGVLPKPPAWDELERLGLVHVRLVGLSDSVVVEVWDVSDEPPRLQRVGDDAEGGRGLLLVQELATRWGSYRTTGGKAVWAQVAVRPPLPRRSPRGERLGGAAVAPPGPDAALLRRIRAGLDTAL
ncbi:ATP-binding protein [Streptomyces microflavus]|jgi:anti-sigma regulatory factor (Ser/Thr protein kinase)|uniref:ATP-binding protein n=1 Tax=Streptomyces microflavus TaxID=1919 RepID=UPI0033C38E9E